MIYYFSILFIIIKRKSVHPHGIALFDAKFFQLIQDIAAAGKCVLYVTSETSEIMAITDRTYVMYGGCVTAELVTANTTEDEIMFYSTGGKENE